MTPVVSSGPDDYPSLSGTTLNGVEIECRPSSRDQMKAGFMAGDYYYLHIQSLQVSRSTPGIERQCVQLNTVSTDDEYSCIGECRTHTNVFKTVFSWCTYITDGAFKLQAATGQFHCGTYPIFHRIWLRDDGMATEDGKVTCKREMEEGQLLQPRREVLHVARTHAAEYPSA